MSKKVIKRKTYSPEFKLSVIMDMRENGLGYKETIRKHALGNPGNGGPKAMLKRWERGEREPLAHQLIDLARVFECSVDYLLGISDVK